MERSRLEFVDRLEVEEIDVFVGCTRGGVCEVVSCEEVGVAGLECQVTMDEVLDGEVDFLADIIGCTGSSGAEDAAARVVDGIRVA